MPLLTRWRPASAAPYMEVALALPDIGRWYFFFFKQLLPSGVRCLTLAPDTYKLGVLSYASPRVRLGGKPVFTGFPVRI